MAETTTPCFQPSKPGTSFSAVRRQFEQGKLTPRAYLEQFIEVIEVREPTVCAFSALNFVEAREAADAATARYRNGMPLSRIDGLPIGIKDLIETADMPTGMGSPLFKEWRSHRDAACVEALRACGAVVVGKTVTTEFGVGASGPTTNPWDARRTPGGSSSGSAAAVGAGMLPAALGTQVVGSIIRPSSFCGVFGYKTSLGALNLGGIHSVVPSQAHLGAHARTLEDVWTICRCIADLTGGEPGYARLGGNSELPAPTRPRALAVLRNPGSEEMDALSRSTFDGYIDRLTSSGAVLHSAKDSPAVAAIEATLAEALDVSGAICCYEMRWPLQSYLHRAPQAIGKRTAGFLAQAARMTDADYVGAVARRAEIRRAFVALSADVDGCLLPSAVGCAPLGLESNGSRSFNALSSGLGAPSFNLPFLLVDGLPLGVQLIGFPDSDEQAAAICHWLTGLFFEMTLA